MTAVAESARTMLDYALEYIARGWAVFPLVPGDKKPLIPKSAGGNGCHDATTDEETVRRWWVKSPRAGIGLHCGTASGVFIVDVDAKNGGVEAWDRLQVINGDAPETLTAQTPGGGFHYYWRVPADRPIGNRQKLKVDGKKSGIDVRGDGGYGVLPPSKHPDGGQYEWHWDADIADAPAWLLDLIDPPKAKPAQKAVREPIADTGDRERNYAAACLRAACDRIRQALEGQRHETLNREAYSVAGYVGSGLIDEHVARAELVAAGLATGKGADEVHRTVSDAIAAGIEAPRRPPGEIGLGVLDRVVRQARTAADSTERRAAIKVVHEDPEALPAIVEAWVERPNETKALLADLRASPGQAKIADKLESDLRKAERERAEEQRKSAEQERRKAAAADEPTRRCDLPEVIIDTDMGKVVDQSMAALVKHAPDIYQRAGKLVVVTRDGARKNRLSSARVGPEPSLQEVEDHYLRLNLSRSVQYVTLQERDGEVERIPSMPPLWVAQTINQMPERPMQTLEAIIEAPTLRHDGSLIDQPGYDDATGLLLVPPESFAVTVPAEPTREEAVVALDKLGDILQDFPFQAKHHRSAALAAILTVVARHAIDGPCPLFLINATTPGSGKTLLADVIGLIAEGRDIAHQPYTENEEEMRKRITSIALAGTRIVLIDNIDGALGGASLDGVLTSRTWSDRELGSSRMTRPIPMFTVWLATGNNVGVRGDLARRVVPVVIDPGVENPEQRNGFVYPRLLAHVAEHRAELLGAALTILRAFVVAKPAPIQCTALGSYEGWSDLVRQSLLWLDQPDPCVGMAALRADGDLHLAQMATLLAAWRAHYGKLPKLLSEVAREVTVRSAPALHAALRDVAGSGEGVDVNRLSMKCRKYAARVIEGNVLLQAGKSHGAVQWRVLDQATALAERGIE